MNQIVRFQDLPNKNIAIVGYGLEGKTTEKFLRKNVSTASIEILDASLDENYLDKLNDSGRYDLAIVTPSLQRHCVKIPYTTATNIFFELCKGKVIGVTGSKGKSTTTYLTYAMLKNLGNHVRIANLTNANHSIYGPPLLEALEMTNDQNNIFVVELSSYQLCDLQHSPHISVITNIFPEHITWHGDFDKYMLAKKQIFLHQTPEDYLIFKPNDSIVSKWAENINSHTIEIDLKEAIDEGNLLITAENKDNARLARAVARLFDVSEEKIINAINSFHPLPNRLNKLGNYGGIIFYDDGAASAPEATISALKALPNTTTLLLGGQDRGYQYEQLMEIIAKSNVSNIILFPETGIGISHLIESKFPNRFKTIITSSMDEAVKFAYENTPPDSVCLLSPAAPSYSLWKNWHEKGIQYFDAIKKYAG